MPKKALSAAVSSPRCARIDALRGLAMLWMTVFHFCFDLNHLGGGRQDFLGDPFWTWQRTGIVSLFLFCAGLSQAVAWRQGLGWPRFWRRWAQVAGCALAVSAATWLWHAPTFVYFGVLHGLALMLIATRLLASWAARHPGPTLALALACIAAKFAAAALAGHAPALEAALNSAWLNWTGLVTRLPVTQDYVPLLPWLGVMLIGLLAGQRWVSADPSPLAGPLPRWAQPLATLGRWSLSYYMLHQPVLIGLLLAWRRLGG